MFQEFVMASLLNQPIEEMVNTYLLNSVYAGEATVAKRLGTGSYGHVYMVKHNRPMGAATLDDSQYATALKVGLQADIKAYGCAFLNGRIHRVPMEVNKVNNK